MLGVNEELISTRENSRSPSREFQVEARLASGKLLTRLTLCPSSKIDDIRDAVVATGEFKPFQPFKLIFGETVLENGAMVVAQGLKEGCVHDG